MRNWNINIKQLSKNPEQYKKFKLESLINYGTQGQKIDKTILKKILNKINIDPKKKNYLKFLLS
jgi:hypothetical protein